ncbi:MAG: thioredoxin [Candidatus Thorarchaeota archaeon]|nr:MAG: thioredoxin [Candidatus Thorarchaeota archaeon]
MIEVKDETFVKEVLEADLPVVVDFWAAWCGPCKAMEPIFKTLAEEYDGKLKFVKVNIDETTLGVDLGVRSIPTFAMFHNGAVAATTSGARSKDRMKEWLAEQIQPETSAK